MSQRILIVEDNKTLAKLIAKKIKSTLDFEVDVAHSFQETKLFLKRYTYFLTLLDINLPDAPNGEIIDYVLEKKNHALVLSNIIDEVFRKNILNKNIIDYISKGGIDDIHYTVQAIHRVQKNQNHTILVVDDSLLFRKKMQKMLENLFFKVITVTHGEEAVGMLASRADISMVITDYNMPVMDGLELTTRIRKEYDKNDLAIIALSSNENEEITARFLKQGANDYINKPFSKEEFTCRVHNSIEALENIQLITNHANRDYLTGLYNRRYFFDAMHNYIKEIQQSGESFAVAMVDIDNFKKVNDTYGHDIGDKVIVALADLLRSGINNKDIVSRFGGEEFCIVLKDISNANALKTLERIRKNVDESKILIKQDEYLHFTISVGAIMYDEMELEETIDEADMMLYKAKNSGKNQVVFKE